jgi:uncharacterized protein YciI
MQFLVIGKDGTDTEAMNRRLAVRDAHIALGDKLFESGNMWYGAALTDEDGKMIGSALMMDFQSREKLDEWLKTEPYVTGDVWKEIEILPCNTRDPWQFNRPKEFFDKRNKA